MAANGIAQSDTTQTNLEKDSIRSYRIEYMKNYHKESKTATPYRKIRKQEHRQNNNVIHGVFGTAFYSVIGGARYERKVKDFFYVRVGYERLYVASFLGSPIRKYHILNIGGSFLIGGNQKFLELGFGTSTMFIDEPKDANTQLLFSHPAYGNEIKINYNIGYRFQEYQGFTFRVGIGRPEGLYISLGRAF